MPSERFKLVGLDEAVNAANGDAWVGGWDADLSSYLLDTWTDEIVFMDGFEPEDCTLDRGFAPLVDLLNAAYPEPYEG